MNKQLLTLALTLIVSLHPLMAQRTCGSPVLPQQFESWLKSVTPVPGKYGSANIQSIFNIPVVVHVIHNNESVNSISATSGNNLNAAQIVDQINILNKDYSAKNADTSLIPSAFKPLMGKFQINFCLAVVNPTGGVMTEPGIDRIDRNVKGWNALPYTSTYIDATVKPNSIWNTSKYLNIWVLPLGGGLLGYATFPNPGTSGLSGLTGSYGSTSTDGVVILNTAFGSIGTAQSGSYNKGRTATHEIGHWVGLRHIWGDSNCGTDYCNDTPPAQTSNFGCPTYPYNTGVCTGNTTGEMTMNYMDYTDDACMQMFTADQKYRAQLILTNSTMRAALITSTVCNLPTVTNDIAISFVAKPTYSQAVSCVNYIDPVINVTNYGSNTVTAVTFSYNVDGINTQTLAWTGTVAPSASFTLAIPQITGLSSGAHVFSVNVSSPSSGTDNNLANNTNQQQFSIVTNSFALSAPSGTTCQGHPIVITASGATSYSWNTGSNTASVSLSPSVTSQYIITASLGVCVMSKTITVTVQAAPVVTLDRTHVCAGMSSTITALGANSYTWSSGENSMDITVTLFNPTTYTVSGASVAGCVTTATYAIAIDPLPIQTLTASYVSCGSCSDATVSTQASGGTAPYTYLWDPGAATTSVITDATSICYKVTVTDALGCASVDSACVSFDTGIFSQPFSNTVFKIMPNPSNGVFTISFGAEGERRVEITDALGRCIQRHTADAGYLKIDIGSYEDGIYYARIFSGNTVTVRKLLKN